MRTLARVDRVALLGLVAVFLSLSVWYGCWNPPGEGVDEAAHLAYVAYVREHRRLPVMPQDGGPAEVWMGHHPPLYYLIGAAVTSFIPMDDAEEALRPNPHFIWAENDGSNGWNAMLHYGQDTFPWRGTILALHITRLASSLLGCISVIAVYLTTRRLLPGQVWAPLGATSLVTLNPSFLFVAGTVHHDVMLVALYSLGILWGVSVSLGFTRVPAWVAGLIAGCAALTKISGLTLLPILGAAILLAGWRRRGVRWSVKAMCQLIGACFLVSGWWYVRNMVLYGDPLGWQMFLRVHHHMVRPTPYTWGIFRQEFLGQVARTFWGAFGFMHITFPEVTRWFWVFSGVSAFGLFALMIPGHAGSLRETLPAWAVALGALAVLFASFVRFSAATLGAGHGRYLFPAAAPIGALLVMGLNAPLRWRCQRFISLGLAALMCAYAIWAPVRYAIPKYRGPRLATESEMANATASAWSFGEGIRLVGYHVEPDIALPGTTLTVRLIWQGSAHAESALDPYVHLLLLDDEGRELDVKSFWPSTSSTPSVWRAQDRVVSEARLYVSPTHASGQLHLGLMLTDGRAGRALLATSGDTGESLEVARFASILRPGTVVEVMPDALPNERREVLGDAIALRGHRLSSESVHPGDTLVVELLWMADSPLVEDYTVFVHCTDQQGNLVAQFDGQPGGGTAPTTSWRPGQILRDSYPVFLPETLAPGRYLVRVGMYTWPSIERLAVSIDGRPAGDSVDLDVVEVLSPR